MKVRTRLSIAFLLVGCLSIYFLVDRVLNDLRPRYLAAMEESMVDTATILASVVEGQMGEGSIEVAPLRGVLAAAKIKPLKATIYEYTKTTMDMRVYIVDRDGTVLLDSNGGRDEGQNYSRWNDVKRTMRGVYGARATHRVPNEPSTVVLFVAAPLRHNGEIIGVLTVGKPAESLRTFLETAQREIIAAGLVIAVAVILLGMAVSRWVSWPIERLTRYAKAVRDEESVPLPTLGNDEIGRLGATFEEMRVALAGKQYVEDYVQTLTHQLKSPVSAIRGAVELLSEDMPEAERKRFYENLRSETERMQALIDRMLHLASLENRQELKDRASLDLAHILHDVLDRPINGTTGPSVTQTGLDTLPLLGERFLLEQAIENLLQNARDFTGSKGTITIQLDCDGDNALLEMHNTGPAIPDYALDRIFDRFYSLPRPDSGKKSTGLGLPFVRKVARLHDGDITLENQRDGVLARLRISTGLKSGL